MAKLKRTLNIFRKKLFFQTHYNGRKADKKAIRAPMNAKKMHANLFKLAKVKNEKRKKKSEKR